MYKIILISILTIWYQTSICQDNWQIYAGLNHSNIIHSRFGQQFLYAHTLNSPLWNYGFQFGVAKRVKIDSCFLLDFGVRVQLKGDRKSLNEIAPDFEYHSIRLLYLMIPFNIRYKLLNSKEIYFKIGLSPGYLIHQNKVQGDLSYFPLHTFKDKISLSGQFGFNFKIKGKISAEIMYSQDLTNIYKRTSTTATGQPMDLTYKNQAFEFTIFYAL